MTGVSAAMKSALTLVALGLIVVFGVFWGFHAATAPFPGRTTVPLCTDRAVSKGDQIYPGEVLVNVYNASTRGGLATNIATALTDRGFVAGLTGNQTDAKVSTVAIWTETPTSPDVLLVLKQLGPKAKVVQHKPLSVGVDVLIGPKFAKLAKVGGSQVKAKQDGTICSPPTS